MKLLISSFIALFSLGLASQASSTLLVSDVGAIDPMIAAAHLSSSGNAAETAWITSIVGTGFTIDFKYEIDTTEPDFTGDQFIWVNNGFDVVTQANDLGLTGTSDEYAWNLPYKNGYFYVKTGNGTYKHWLFQNTPSTNWGTIVLGGAYNDVTTMDRFGNTTIQDIIFDVKDIHSISHIGSGGTPVPEPATMFLFGIGVAGLVGSRLRKKN